MLISKDVVHNLHAYARYASADTGSIQAPQQELHPHRARHVESRMTVVLTTIVSYSSDVFPLANRSRTAAVIARTTWACSLPWHRNFGSQGDRLGTLTASSHREASRKGVRHVQETVEVCDMFQMRVGCDSEFSALRNFGFPMADTLVER